MGAGPEADEAVPEKEIRRERGAGCRPRTIRPGQRRLGGGGGRSLDLRLGGGSSQRRSAPGRQEWIRRTPPTRRSRRRSAAAEQPPRRHRSDPLLDPDARREGTLEGVVEGTHRRPPVPYEARSGCSH